jgi:hypothetical protein
MVRKSDNRADCDCCAGVDASTPQRIENPPGLSSINYRIGNYSDFVESMQARLSSVDFPALAGLTTRESSDFSIALSDALACSLDVLSFYTERYAQEHYLRTATERLSVGEMARLIGYQLAPGVAASTHLAFTLQSLPGAPAEPIEIPIGTRVQSVPGQDEVAQTFETVAKASARAEWNAIPVQTSIPWKPQSGDTELWLAGIDTQLKAGDAILVVGSDRMINAGSEHWDVRVLASVETDNDNARTRVTWNHPLGSRFPTMSPAIRGIEVHALRQRTALFGHSAPDPNLMSLGAETTGSNISELIDTNPTIWEWKKFEIDETQIDLDTDNAKITTDSWIALVSNQASQGSDELPGYTELYRARKVQHRTRKDFGLSSKITRITPDTTENLTASRYDLRRTLVLAQSEKLDSYDTPLFHPLYGDALVCGELVEDLQPDQPLAVSGMRQRIVIAAGVTGLALQLDDGGSRSLNEGDELFMAGPTVRLIGTSLVALDAASFYALIGSSSARLRLMLLDRDGNAGKLDAKGNEVQLQASQKDDEIMREIIFIASGDDAVDSDRDRTSLKLAAPLEHVYERASVRVNANVAASTHGETVDAILGSGDGGSENQRFALNQSPLTYVSASTPIGRASSLQLRVNDVLWEEVPTLYASDADARVYETMQNDAATTTIQFGDGVEGARLPSGESNLRVSYRKGLGVGGNVGVGKLSTLLSRPLGVTEVVNPQAASGGEDAETLSRARDNAPLTVLTLERAVSIDDYANFARAFAGIDKAHALWIPAGPARGVFLSIAGVDGALVAESGETFGNLLDALTSYGDPLVPLRMSNYSDARFRCGLSVKVLAEYEVDKVREKIDTTLRNHFSFSGRRFGQTVSVDEVAAVAQAVKGVEAVHVTRLHRVGESVDTVPRLFAKLPVASLTELPNAAELLTLADEAIELEVLQ